MALRDHWFNSERQARLKMEEEARRVESEIELQKKIEANPEDEKFIKTYRVRGKLYDKIKVSLHTMDIIIYAIVALIVVALIVGIAIGN